MRCVPAILIACLLVASAALAQTSETDGDQAAPRGIAAATVTAAGGMVAMRDIEYGLADGRPLLLDAYLPAEGDNHPVMISIHGGGWSQGDKSRGFEQINENDSLIRTGIARVSIGYRLSGVAPYPAAVNDCLAAIRWVRAHADELRINPDRLAAWGGSAGGHLSLMMAYLEPGPEDLDAQGNHLQNFLCCVGSVSGPTELAADDMYRTSQVPQFLGVPREQAPELYAAASPLTHVSPDDPPTVIIHGTADATVPYTQAVKLAARLEEMGVPHEFFTIEGGTHGANEGIAKDKAGAALTWAWDYVKSCLLAEDGLTPSDYAAPRGLAAATVTTADGVVAARDIEYGRVDGHSLRLDAYLPADNQVHPALIFIHGGGWSSGDKAGGFQNSGGTALTAAGIAVFSLNYRLSGTAPYPAAVDDCLAAIRWIRAHAGELRVDPDRLATEGNSAGAHLALMMGYLEPGPGDLDAQGRQLQNFVRCMVSVSGPTELAVDDMYEEGAVRAFVGVPREQAPQLYAAASPITHVSADDPPAFFVHGTADQTVPYTQVERLMRKLDELGVGYELVPIEGGGHSGGGPTAAQHNAAMVRAVEFVKAHLLAD